MADLIVVNEASSVSTGYDGQAGLLRGRCPIIPATEVRSVVWCSKRPLLGRFGAWREYARDARASGVGKRLREGFTLMPPYNVYTIHSSILGHFMFNPL